MKTLEALNFRNSFLKWIRILYKDINSQVMVNGALAENIKVTNSVRLGCPILMLLLVIGAKDLPELRI